jgi:hypothetical protein
MRKLTKEHQAIILNFGYPKTDLKQIEDALSKTDFEQYWTEIDKEDEKITIEKAIEILGEELFLSGICRSAFHSSATREKKGIKVYFNSSRLFRK